MSTENQTVAAHLTRSAGLVGMFTLCSRILGLIRDSLIAAFYPKRITDAFFVAYTIPNVLRQLLAEGALTVAFIPVFTPIQQSDPVRAKRMLENMVGAALVVLTVVTALGVWGAPLLVRLFAYGFVDEPERLHLAIFLLRVMFPFLIGVALTALAMGVLNAVRHFAAPASAPIVLNIVIIGAVFLGTAQMHYLGLPPITALALGVLIGGFAQLMLQLIVLRRYQLLVTPRFEFTDPGVVQVAKLMVPSVLGLAMYQLNVIIARQFASLIGEGAISAIYYAQRLIEFPNGILAVSMATVSLPELSRQASRGDYEQVKATYRFALRSMVFVMLPATLGLMAIGEPLVRVLFERGAFGPEMTRETTVTLIGFLFGLCAASGVRQTVPVYYAMQDTRTPVKIAAVCLAIYTLGAAFTYRKLGTFGLAVSVALSSNVNLALLGWGLHRRLGSIGLRKMLGSWTKASLAALLSAAVAYWISRMGDDGGMAAQIFWLFVAISVAGLFYLGAAAALRCSELVDLVHAIRERRRKRN